jgi:hypothetical protein
MGFLGLAALFSTSNKPFAVAPIAPQQQQLAVTL